MGKYEKYEGKMEKVIDNLKYEYSSIRAGRANPTVLDKLTVDYYGAPTPINQMAAISVPEPRMLVVQPWDASTLRLIEKAIQTSDLGINPTNDGKVIRITFPPLTAERRQELVKKVAKYAEEAKVAVRNVRRDAMDDYKAQKKKSEITEDDLKNIEKDIQKLTDDYCKKVDGVKDDKEKEITEL